MKVGVPKEVKDKEFRVAITPTMVRGFVAKGHEVHIETSAGDAIGFTDEMYSDAGAIIEPTAKSLWNSSELILKVKEPQKSEFPLMHEGQVLFCYLHLAPDLEQTQQLINQNVIAIAYETVTDRNGRLPLLTPMSEIAGRLATQSGAWALQKANGGRGLLLGGVPGVKPAEVLIIGGGIVGTNAAQMAIGMGADVTIVDRSLDRLRELDAIYRGRLKTLYSSDQIIEQLLQHVDLVVGAVLIPGGAAPKLINRNMLKLMKKGSVIVDVAVDQGGMAETTKPTTHSDPVYIVDDVVHYCVSNMPGAAPRHATKALTNATYPFAIALADKGYRKALLENTHLRNGLNVFKGRVTNEPVAKALGFDYISPKTVLEADLVSH